MQKTYYTIYKITNQIDGKIYIGSHKTKNLNDRYMGSGKYLKYAQDKYGIEKFEKEILFMFDTAQEMYAKEAEIVDEQFIAENNTYNIKVGGFGGFDYLNQWPENPTHTRDHMQRMSALGAESRNNERRNRFANDIYRRNWGEMSTQRQLEQYAAGRMPGMLGKRHNTDTKRMISQKKRGHGTSGSNSNAKSVVDDNGRMFDTISDCAKFHNIHPETVANRIRRGLYTNKTL